MRPEKSPRKGALPLLLFVTLAAALVFFWRFLPGGEEDAAHNSRAGERALSAPDPALAGPAPDAPLPPRDSPEFAQALLRRCAPWLASRGRDAASLVALWELSGEESLLLEAAEKFPDDPRVCVSMIDYLYKKSGDALPWAERLIKNEPDNPAGRYWKALLIAYSHGSESLARDGKPLEDALDALRAATDAGGRPDAHLRERVITRREALLAGGAGPREAALVALTPSDSAPAPLYMFNGKTMGVLTRAIDAAKAEGNTARVEEIAALGAAMGEHLGLINAPSLFDEMVRISMLSRTLKELPPETEYGDDGRTAGARLAEIEADRAELSALTSGLPPGLAFMDSLTDSQTAEFADRVLLHGEAAAFRWLRSQTAKTGAVPGDGPR